ncbi:CinA family protein [Rothia nasimurium]|uniref:CinA family protein n=1 Tax=Rothia nasimurium TaxID=85336 RepID=UPI001F3439A2|nr:CinA family protein [Rothia nasimurium]
MAEIKTQELERAATRLVAVASAQTGSRATSGADAGTQLATAESLTGGMVGQLICTVPGASAVYRGGVISYATEVKASVLGVPADLLAERGAVDPDVAIAMAQGTARVCEADFGVATTGAAGPEPCDGKPVGRVYLAVAHPVSGGVRVLEKNYDGNRAEIRAQAAYDALNLLADFLAETVK